VKALAAAAPKKVKGAVLQRLSLFTTRAHEDHSKDPNAFLKPSTSSYGMAVVYVGGGREAIH
jgi:hypothetical protein